MDAFTTLLNTYSLEGIIVFIITLMFAVKAIGTTVEWIWGKVQKKFNIKTDSDRLDEIIVRFDSVESRMNETDRRLAHLQEQMLQNAKSYIIDKHHYYCYKAKCIDDMSLQLLEIRYAHYVGSGGNSYVGTLMAEIRALPRVSVENITHIQEEV